MSRDRTILAQFESLPELREETLNGTQSEQEKAQKAVEKLLSQEPIIEDILVVLDQQRRFRDELDITEDIPPITDARREAHMADELRHIIPYFLERAFSLPVDYRIPREKRWTRELYEAFIDVIVIQPEYLSDDFLVSLGLMSSHEKKTLTQGEKISKKIKLIPEIKQLLKTLAHLRLGGRKITGRVARVDDPKSRLNGGYIVFQEKPGMEKKSDKKHGNMRRPIIPRFYKDHYSLIRSQRYAKEKLRDKTKFLRELRDEIIPSMQRRWEDSDYGVEEKRKDVLFLRSLLAGQDNFHEKRALDRIEKIAFVHPEQDRMRLMGAGNDIITAIEQKIGKNNEISGQTEWLLDSERQVRSAFEPFYEEIMEEIEHLNQVFEGFDRDSLDEIQSLTGVQAHAFNRFLKVVEGYNKSLKSMPEIGAPFQRIPGLIEGYLQSMEKHREERKKSIGLLGVRHTLSFIIELKKIRYEVMKKEAEYRIKVGGERMGTAAKEKLSSKIEKVRTSLESTRFLPFILLLPAGQEKFGDMINALNGIILSLAPESE